MDDAQHWENEWTRRIGPNGTEFNTEKVDILCQELWSRPYLANLIKLDVGCGTGYHAASMAAIYPQWKDTYYGIDLSESAIKKAESYGLEAYATDIYDVNPDFLPDIETFMFLDVLEHIEDHERLAEKVKELAANKFMIFGNVPLYLTKSNFERPIDVNDIGRFVAMCGIEKFSSTVYGVRGFPYLTFEAANAEDISAISAP